MKIVKIIFAILAALWALALIPKLLAGISQGSGAFAFSHIMGSVVGILIATAISITLFRSAFKK
jgi:Na+/alanine symporter